MLWQPALPDRYLSASDAELEGAVRARKAELGDRVVILGHHYQQDQVIQFADFTGDSFKLSQLAARRVRERGSKYVVFAGVHFMAESADVLTPEDVAVILPDMSAGCSMADMADYDETVDAWERIREAMGPGAEGWGEEMPANPRLPQASSLKPQASSPPRVIPICYMNSSAAIKAFCGEHGGAVCTSSNCQRIFRWALAGGSEPLEAGQRVKILFIPDQHLGRNSAAALGYDVERDMVVWDPKSSEGGGGVSGEDIRRAVFILWKGHCSVHKLFRPEHVDQARAAHPGVRVIVHPECCHEVVRKADMSGSTEKIIHTIEQAAPGSKWAVGTEVHMVTRLAREAAARGVEVTMLSGCQCLCTTMYRIDLPHLLWTLDNLAAGKVVNQVKVHPQVRGFALVALERMLQITGDPRWAGAETPAIQQGSLIGP